jgi:hypothetical protein
MAEVLQIKPNRKFVVARGAHSGSPYLAKDGEAFRWQSNIHSAVRFTSEEEAESMAARVAGGATVAELIEA